MLGASVIVPVTVVPLDEKAPHEAILIREVMKRPKIKFFI
jgi:hypothetical protein